MVEAGRQAGPSPGGALHATPSPSRGPGPRRASRRRTVPSSRPRSRVRSRRSRRRRSQRCSWGRRRARYWQQGHTHPKEGVHCDICSPSPRAIQVMSLGISMPVFGPFPKTFPHHRPPILEKVLSGITRLIRNQHPGQLLRVIIQQTFQIRIIRPCHMREGQLEPIHLRQPRQRFHKRLHRIPGTAPHQNAIFRDVWNGS